MNSTFNRLACALIVGSALSLVAPGVAHADDTELIGMTFSKAKTAIGHKDMEADVATVVGDRLPQDQCFVVGAQRVTTRDASGDKNETVMQVDLNCYKSAGKKNPGFSAGDNGLSTSAVRTQEAAALKEWKQKTESGKKWCAAQRDAHPTWAIPDCIFDDE
jgi:hypothetical protein